MHIDTFHCYFSLEVHTVGLSRMKYSLLGVFCEKNTEEFKIAFKK